MTNPEITDLAQNVGERIAASSCILEIHIRQPGFRKKMNSAQFLGVSGNAGNISADVLTVAKDILEKRDISYLEAHRTSFLKELKGYSVYGAGMTLGNGQYLMPLVEVEKITNLIDKFTRERNELLDRFEASYGELIEKAKGKLGRFFYSWEYPPFAQIRNRYRLDYKFISNSVPEELKKVSDQLYQKEKRRIDNELKYQVDDLKAAGREAYLGLLTHFTETLGRDEATGKFHALKENRVNELLEFIERFNNKNLIGDVDLKAQVDAAREALQGIGVRQMRTDTSVREQLSQVFEDIKNDTTPLVSSGRRQMRLEPPKLAE